MALTAIASVQVGSAIATGLFDDLGASGVTLLRLGFATALLALALAWAAQRVDWIGLQSDRGLRAAILAAVLAGVAALYFAALRVTGLRLSEFSRRG